MPLPSESIHSEEDLAEWENSENGGDEEDSFQADDDDQQQEDVDGEDEDDDQEREVEQDGGDDEIASDGDGDDDDDDESANIEDYATDDDADDGAAEQWDDEPGEDEENDDYYDDLNGGEEYQEDEEYYDDENGQLINEYADENEYDAYVIGEDVYLEEYEEDLKHLEEKRKRERLLLILLCCCCCLLLATTIGLSLGLWKAFGADDEPVAPPPNTTFFFIEDSTSTDQPTSPPTEIRMTDVPDRAVNNVPSRDTSIFESGVNATIPQGGSDTVLVQNGPPDDPTQPRAYALLNFHWNETGHPWYTQEQLEGYFVKGQLCVERLPAEPKSGTIVYSVCRLPNLGFDVERELESLTGADQPFSLPGSCFSAPVTFDVDQRSTSIQEYCVDVTPFMTSLPPFQPEPQRKLRRQLQRVEDYRNVLFAVFNFADEQYGSDRFYSKEAGDRAPKLILDLFTDGPPTDPPNPLPTSSPTPEAVPQPTVAPQTATDAPQTATSAPVPAPQSGTSAPSISMAPSVSLAPTWPVINAGCSICPLYNEVPPENWPIDIELEIRPGMIRNQVPCQELDELCKDGYCHEQVCQGAAYVSDICGCQTSRFAVSDDREPCNICGEPNMVMTNPDTFVTIPEGLSPPGFGTRVICSRMLQSGLTGFFTPNMCSILPSILSEPCGCVRGDSGVVDDGLEDGICNICGPNMDMMNPDANATIPEEIAIPGLERTLKCSEIQDACDANLCDPLDQCTTFPVILAETCGCVSRAPTSIPSTQPSVAPVA